MIVALWFLMFGSPPVQDNVVRLPRVDRPPAVDLPAGQEIGFAVREFRQRDPNDGQPASETTAEEGQHSILEPRPA